MDNEHLRDFALSIIELAENQKELVRIIKSFPNYAKLLKTIQGPALEGRLEAVYKKASSAKARLT